MDKLIIQGAPFLCNIGISPKERKLKQEIIIDAELFLDIKRAAQKDNIKNAVNYSKVYDLIKKTVEEKKYKLIETMAEDTARGVLKNFDIRKVLIKIRKPSALADKNVKYVAVEVLREKNG